MTSMHPLSRRPLGLALVIALSFISCLAGAHEQNAIVDGKRVQPTPEMIERLQDEHREEQGYKQRDEARPPYMTNQPHLTSPTPPAKSQERVWEDESFIRSHTH